MYAWLCGVLSSTIAYMHYIDMLHGHWLQILPCCWLLQYYIIMYHVHDRFVGHTSTQPEGYLEQRWECDSGVRTTKCMVKLFTLLLQHTEGLVFVTSDRHGMLLQEIVKVGLYEHTTSYVMVFMLLLLCSVSHQSSKSIAYCVRVVCHYWSFLYTKCYTCGCSSTGSTCDQRIHLEEHPCRA
jgi:hypothetical protein